MSFFYEQPQGYWDIKLNTNLKRFVKSEDVKQDPFLPSILISIGTNKRVPLTDINTSLETGYIFELNLTENEPVGSFLHAILPNFENTDSFFDTINTELKRCLNWMINRQLADSIQAISFLKDKKIVAFIEIAYTTKTIRKYEIPLQ